MDIKTLCKRYNLIAPREFWESSEVKLNEIYNGAGPDDFNGVIRFMLRYAYPKLTVEDSEGKLREYITEFISLFKGAVAIHDFEFTYSDKKKETFDEVNSRLLSNCMKIIDKEFPFSSIFKWHKRIHWRGKARLTYYACQKCGWDAWND